MPDGLFLRVGNTLSSHFVVNLLQTNASLLYLLKTTESQRFTKVFRSIEVEYSPEKVNRKRHQENWKERSIVPMHKKFRITFIKNNGSLMQCCHFYWKNSNSYSFFILCFENWKIVYIFAYCVIEALIYNSKYYLSFTLKSFVCRILFFFDMVNHSFIPQWAMWGGIQNFSKMGERWGGFFLREGGMAYFS